MTELELYIELMTVYLYDNFLFLRQILTLMCQITSEGYFSGNFRSPGGSCQLWLAHPCTRLSKSGMHFSASRAVPNRRVKHFDPAIRPPALPALHYALW